VAVVTHNESAAATTVHPLRLAYARTLQAIFAVHVVRIDVDPELGGSPYWLGKIERRLTEAQAEIQKLAAAERINLGDHDDA